MRFRAPRQILLPLLLSAWLLSETDHVAVVSAFEWASTGRPEVTREAIAGLWKLTPAAEKARSTSKTIEFPMKEFTVYPKKPRKSKAKKQRQQEESDENLPELLLMLKEDGSFHQYSSGLDVEEYLEDEEGRVDIDATWSTFQKKRKDIEDKASSLKDVVRGIWDYRDGKLILAADRTRDGGVAGMRIRSGFTAPPPPSAASSPSAASRRDSSPPLPGGDGPVGALSRDGGPPKSGDRAPERKQHPDTLLVGRVVATYEDSLQENPVVSKDQQQPRDDEGQNQDKPVATLAEATEGGQSSSSSASENSSLDTHLSVPKGSVKVGKFFYPKKHPSFFDQPMFQPVRQGTFQLRQVLGSLNTKNNEQEQEIEKFHRDDFYNKTFLLTTSPIGNRNRPKGSMRWSIKYNKFVRDPPPRQGADARRREEEERSRPVSNIRVMEVAFFANDTFSTVGGLGESVILRGKYDVIGHDKDQLWMQVIRFGFGRSVSGSVYSEGRMLTHEDAKTYWGTISYEKDEREEGDGVPSNAREAGDAKVQGGGDAEAREEPERLEVKGSVLFGSGLEPMPVARFIMREKVELDEMDEDEDDDGLDDDDDDEEDIGGISELKINLEKSEDDGIDWSTDSDAAFQ